MKHYQQKKPFELRYRWFVGSFAWMLHRLSGLALVLYLVLHMYSIHFLAKDAAAFDALMRAYASPLFKIGEVLLWGAFVYHATNGLRIVWMDLFGGSRYHKKLFVGTLVVAGVLFVAGAIPMLQHAFGG
jgi:succinate dehydrogenase / fumarate reductase, cytochrome b subunit